MGLTVNVQRLTYILNPMASLVSTYRIILYNGARPAPDFFLRTLVTCLATLVLGYSVFARHSAMFAEEV
jgi:ABC-type polysaccharide/polyol phosphate export permease